MDSATHCSAAHRPDSVSSVGYCSQRPRPGTDLDLCSIFGHPTAGPTFGHTRCAKDRGRLRYTDFARLVRDCQPRQHRTSIHDCACRFSGWRNGDRVRDHAQQRSDRVCICLAERAVRYASCRCTCHRYARLLDDDQRDHGLHNWTRSSPSRRVDFAVNWADICALEFGPAGGHRDECGGHDPTRRIRHG